MAITPQRQVSIHTLTIRGSKQRAQLPTAMGDGVLCYITTGEQERLVWLRTEFGYDHRKFGEYLLEVAEGEDDEDGWPFIPPNGYELAITSEVRKAFPFPWRGH